MYVLNNAVEKLSDKRNEAAAEEGTPDTERGRKKSRVPQWPASTRDSRETAPSMRVTSRKVANEDASLGPRELWRGLSNVKPHPKFWSHGGLILSPMSTSVERKVALEYALKEGTNALILRLEIPRFGGSGAPLEWVSCYPDEAEYLYPPLCMLNEPKRSKLVMRHGSSKFTIACVEPRIMKMHESGATSSYKERDQPLQQGQLIDINQDKVPDLKAVSYARKEAGSQTAASPFISHAIGYPSSASPVSPAAQKSDSASASDGVPPANVASPSSDAAPALSVASSADVSASHALATQPAPRSHGRTVSFAQPPPVSVPEEKRATSIAPMELLRAADDGGGRSRKVSFQHVARLVTVFASSMKARGEVDDGGSDNGDKLFYGLVADDDAAYV